MAIAVLGAGGLLGRHLVAEISRAGGEARGFDRAACSIEDPAAVSAAVRGCQVVVNAAAFTDVDGAERDPDAADRGNAVGAENVARAAAAADAVCVHVSTDFVFDGAKADPYRESDPPRPLSAYGRSKLDGERRVARAAPRSHVVRVQALYGPGGRNFSSRLRAFLRDGKTLRIDRERRVQPTSARAAARMILAIAQTRDFGIWHASCSGATTWAGFCAHLAARLALPTTWESVPSSALTLPAARPPNCLFAHERLRPHGITPPSWEAALDEYLAEEEGSK